MTQVIKGVDVHVKIRAAIDQRLIHRQSAGQVLGVKEGAEIIHFPVNSLNSFKNVSFLCKYNVVEVKIIILGKDFTK